MFTLLTVSFSLLFITLAGLTLTTYLIREDSRKFIKEELKNLFDICKMLSLSLKSLAEVLVKYSFSSKSEEATTAKSKKLDEQLLQLVEPVQPVQPVEAVEAVEAPSFELPVQEDEDIAMSSFSPELIEVITEEEEKIA